ncbi:reverse transcriptase domain-containing protein [Tanacetum coccineum]
MDDPNMTMEEYIKLEEEKGCRRGRVFYWQTATYRKIRVDDDLHDLRSVEAEFPAIVINDDFAPQDALQCKLQIVYTAYSGEWIRRIDILYNFRVLYKVEDIATYLVEYVKFWDDWEVDRYGNANLVTADQETYVLNKLHGVSFISKTESDTPKVLQHQLPRKELNPVNFTLPFTIGKFNFYAMADLGASINVMPRSIFEHLHLTNLKKTNMLCEMADMSKKAPLGIVENVLVKIDKFVFPSDFVIIDNTPFETTIIGRPFLATIHAEIDVFAGKITLGINEDIISFDTMRKDHNYTNPSEIFFMVRPQSPAQSNRGNVNFEIKSQFMRELREDTFSGNKDEDAHDHIDRVLSIVGLFNIPGVSKDAVML